MKRIALYVCVLVLAVVFFVIGLFNRANVDVDYIVGQTSQPLVFVMLACFVFGALLTLFVFGIRMWYWKSRSKAFEKQLELEHREAAQAQVRKDFEEVRQA